MRVLIEALGMTVLDLRLFERDDSDEPEQRSLTSASTDLSNSQAPDLIGSGLHSEDETYSPLIAPFGFQPRR